MISLAAEAAPVTVRVAWPEDQAFVAATMAEQLERAGGRHGEVHAIVNRVLDSQLTRVVVAERERRLLGWLAYAAIPRVRAVLFMYVRRDERGGGIARDLADAAWPSGRGQWVHAGLRGGSTRSVLQRFAAIAMPLDDLL